jgi:hypothetical protein
MKGADIELCNNNYKKEMNELIESSPEQYQPDSEDLASDEREDTRDPLSLDLSDLFSDDESLQGSQERNACMK